MQPSFDKHRAEPNLSIDEYVRRCRIDLGRSLENRVPIYLDKRYWIIIRDVALQRTTDTASIELLSLLRILAKNNSIFCPISDILFVELLKQQDLKTRRATAELIDEFSLGVTFAPEDERVGTELAHFFYSHTSESLVYPLRWLIWSRLSYVLGIVHPTKTPFDADTELIIQKAFFDHMWNIPLVKVVDTLGTAISPQNDFRALANKLNESNRQHINEIRSFEQAYFNEISGGLSLYVGRAVDILEHMFERATGSQQRIKWRERKVSEEELHRFFVSAYKKSEIAKLLPTLHIHALCQAAIRRDKRQKLEGNDIYDFHHAAAAVAYCRVFLTERPLQVMLTANHIALHKGSVSFFVLLM